MSKKLILLALIIVLGVSLAWNHYSRAQEAFSIPELKKEAGWKVVKEKETWITAYSSTPDQTDSTPFITASGSTVRDGIVAANWLPIGTKVRIPEAYGDKIFVVEDRMHPRHNEKVDIWMPTRNAAVKWGRQKMTVQVVQENKDIEIALK